MKGGLIVLKSIIFLKIISRVVQIFVANIYLIYYLLLILVKKNNIINDILNKWKLINPSFEIKYFSDADLDVFFKNTPYNDIYKNVLARDVSRYNSNKIKDIIN